MATNDFKAFAIGAGANVVSQSAYILKTEIANGFSSGIAESNMLNKVWRQSSTMAQMIGKVITDSGLDALDNGAINTLAANFLAALLDQLGPNIISSINAGKGRMMVAEMQGVGIDAGSAVAGNNIRPLNSIIYNSISGASLSSSRITLPPGFYKIKAVTMTVGTKWCQAFLYNVTNGVDVGRGLSNNGSLNTDSDPVGTTSEVQIYYSVPSTKSIELRVYCQQAKATFGLGRAVGSGTEVYSFVDIEKL